MYQCLKEYSVKELHHASECYIYCPFLHQMAAIRVFHSLLPNFGIYYVYYWFTYLHHFFLIWSSLKFFCVNLFLVFVSPLRNKNITFVYVFLLKINFLSVNHQDSGDPGNHSDVTEELYEMKPSELPFATQTLGSNQETKQEPSDARFSEEPQISMSLPSPTDGNDRSLQEEKHSSSIIASESSAADFSFPISKEKSDQDFPLKQDESSSHRCHQCLTNPSAQISSSHVGKNIPLFASPVSSSSLELAVVPRETSSNLASVLEALQRAKLSLNQKLNSNVFKPSNPETDKVDTFQFPINSPGLFRLPTDYQFEATARANLHTDARPSFANFPHEIAPSAFLSEPFAASRSALSAELFNTVPSRPPLTPEIRRGILPPQRSISQPRLSEGQHMDHLDPYMNHVLPSIKDHYPFLPDVALRLSLNEEGASRTFSGSERGLPPVMRLSSSPNDERVRPNMHR